MNDPISQIKSHCDGHWDVVIEALTGFNGKPTHCPRHGGNSGKAFYGKKSKYAQTGMTFCNTCGCNNDGINSLAFIKNSSIADAVKLLIEYIGGIEMDADDRLEMEKRRKALAEKQRQSERQHFKKAISDINQLINASDYLNEARRYFVNRGLKLLANCYYRDIHFVRSAKHYENGIELEHDAIIGIMRDVDHNIRNVQRIFVDSDFNKASCDHPKKMMPAPKEGWQNGSAVWMRPKFNQMSGVLHVCEGIETGHAVLSNSPLYAEMACCLTAGNLAQFDIPKDIGVLVIWADNDGETMTADGSKINTGIDKAKQLKEKAKSDGIHTIIISPTQKGDWNDYQDECKQKWHQLLNRLKVSA